MRSALFFMLALCPALAAGVPRAESFPVEGLPAAVRDRADALLVKMLDSEALYTVTGGLKPVSEGFWQHRFAADRDTTPEVEATRAVLKVVRVGDELEAGVYVFAKAHEGRKTASAYVAHLPAMRRTIAAHPAVFGKLGVTADDTARSALEKVDRGDEGSRWRAFGLLFGYPPHAVDFFVEAGLSQKKTGAFVPRDFLSIPTVAGDTGRFVYAVAKGHKPNDADVALRGAAAPLLAEYRRRRADYVGRDKPGVGYLVRDWFDDGTGRCSSSRERVKFYHVGPGCVCPPAGR